MRKLLILFQESLKQNSAANSFTTAEISLSVNLFIKKNTSSRCVLSMHKLSNHDHVIYGAAKEAAEDKLAYLSTNLNSAPSPTARKPNFRHMEED